MIGVAMVSVIGRAGGLHRAVEVIVIRFAFNGFECTRTGWFGDF